MSKKVAYVTGGMGGIGTAICQRLAQDGFTVVAGEVIAILDTDAKASAGAAPVSQAARNPAQYTFTQLASAPPGANAAFVLHYLAESASPA